MQRPLPQSSAIAMSALPRFGTDTFFFVLMFSALFTLVPNVFETIFPKVYGSMDDRKRNEMPSYVVCLVHHIAMVPLTYYHIFVDFNLSDSEAAGVDYARTEAFVAPFCVAYLFADTIYFALGEFIRRRNVEYIVHHVTTLSLVMSTLYAPSGINR